MGTQSLVKKKQESMLFAVALWTAMFFSFVGSNQVYFLGCFHIPSYSIVWAKNLTIFTSQYYSITYSLPSIENTAVM